MALSQASFSAILISKPRSTGWYQPGSCMPICQHCQGNVRITACIKDKSVIDIILSHINKKPGQQSDPAGTFTIRGPPELVSLITKSRLVSRWREIH